MNFPDVGHLRQLQRDLWRWPKSRATVLVGAGLSLNAAPLPGVTARFSTWRQLARAMFDELHPAASNQTAEQAAAREASFSSSNPLRLASEYEAAFDRRKLEALIRERNPDSDYEPGLLHNVLLELPWADVFTTNYDTLLERTELRGRAYQLVVKSDDLTTAAAPRIVKLHGSFPSHTPFIITEEDYRTYPRRFAPFVNSVQQALLENSMVLIGFSGDDPNFFEWTGWIRDELGDKHAPIYLVGPLSLGQASRALLSRRGVTPIDLSPFFEGRNPPNGIYAACIEWFLRSLAAAQPARPEKWPDIDTRRMTTIAGAPPILGAPSIPPAEIDMSPRGPIDASTVTRVVARWRAERKSYPGWLVPTDDKRASLWTRTKYWIEPLAAATAKWAPEERLRLFHEINSRLEIAFVPLFTSWINHIERALNETLDAVLSGRVSQGTILADSDEDVRDVWVNLLFALLREARETYNAKRWHDLKNQVDFVVAQRPQHKDRVAYEAALWSMWNADRPTTKATMDSWQPSPQHPITAMWKAGLLAELDELGEARTLLRSALIEIRRSVRHHGKNIALLSLEGWCSYLLFAVESAADFGRYEAIRDEFWERWHELKAWDCSPWPHKDHFDEVLKGPPPEIAKDRQEVRGFDPGAIMTSVHWQDDTITPFLPAFAWIRLHEVVGVPMRLRRFNINGKVLANACAWISQFIGFWSPALLIRAGETSQLTEGDFLSRTKVAAMDRQLATRLYLWSLEIFQRELASLTDRIEMDSWQEAILEVLPEVLSRLAFKVEAEHLRPTFPLVLQYHKQAAIRAHIRLHEASTPWFRRLFEAADRELLLQWLAELIRVPLFEGGSPSVLPAHQASPDPMQHFPAERLKGSEGVPEAILQRITDATDWLLKRAASESGEGRQRALRRLADVWEAKLMTAGQQAELGQLLWSRTAASGLPDLQNFAAFGFLHLPAPAGVNVTGAVKKYISSLDAAGFVKDEEGKQSILVNFYGAQPLIFEASLATKPVVQLRGEALGMAEWSAEEAEELYMKARSWWNNDKVAFDIVAEGKLFAGVGAEPVRSTLNKLGRYLARAVIPNVNWQNEAQWIEVEQWLREIRTLGVFGSVALPYIVSRRPERAAPTAAILLDDLDSENEGACESAAKALRHWIHLARIGAAPLPSSDLLMKLVARVVFRRKPGIFGSLGELTYLIVDASEVITREHASLLIGSLIPWHHAIVLPLPEGQPSEFNEAERPDLRTFVGRLAGALSIWWKQRVPDTAEPKPLTFWRDVCSSDPLPEVRRAFIAWDAMQSS